MTIDYDSLRSELANQFGIRELTYPASGDDSDTFLYGDCYVVKVPKHENVIAIGDPDNDFLYLLDCSTDDFGKEFGRKVLYYYGHKAPEIAEKKAEINDAYWTIQQILLGDKRQDRRLLAKGIDELSDLDIQVLDNLLLSP